MARTYEELRKLIYVYLKKFNLNLEKLNDLEAASRILVLEWYGEKLLGRSTRKSTVPNTQYERMDLSFRWHPLILETQLRREQFANDAAFWREYEKKAKEIINQFTDEELFIVASRAWKFDNYVRDSRLNYVDRNFIAKVGCSTLISVEVEFLTKASSSSSSGCYITTAVCSSENKSDDCYELETFRSFRDNWLSNQKDGKALIYEYYATAPQIVKRIDESEDAVSVYAQLRKDYLDLCLKYIKLGEMEQCKNLYIEMVKVLQKKYL